MIDEEGDRNPFAGDSTRESPDAEPNAALWIPYLIFRPAYFFRHYAVDTIPFITLCAALAMGIVVAMDRIDTSAMRAIERGDPAPFEGVIESWSLYWGMSLFLGVIFAFFCYWIGGWWYRLRLRWSGVPFPDRTLAVRVYLYASFVYVLPNLLYVAWETDHYPTPRAAMMGTDLWVLGVMLFLLWSVYVSYRGVRTVFDVRKGMARLWFLILPGLVYGLVVTGVVLLAAFGSTVLFDDVPDTAVLREHEGRMVSFARPGNWTLELLEQSSDVESYQVESLLADSAANISVYPYFEEDLEGALTGFEGRLRGNTAMGPPRDRVSVDRWGAYEGRGMTFMAELDGFDYRVLCFVASGSDWTLEVLEICEVSIEEIMRPGFEVVRRSARIHPLSD